MASTVGNGTQSFGKDVWKLLDLSSEPAPGDPIGFANLARTCADYRLDLLSVANRASTARYDNQKACGTQALSAGLERIGEDRDLLLKISECFAESAALLDSHAASLQRAQDDADHLATAAQLNDAATSRLEKKITRLATEIRELNSRIRNMPDDADAGEIEQIQQDVVDKERQKSAAYDQRDNLMAELRELSEQARTLRAKCEREAEELGAALEAASDRVGLDWYDEWGWKVCNTLKTVCTFAGLALLAAALIYSVPVWIAAGLVVGGIALGVTLIQKQHNDATTEDVVWAVAGILPCGRYLGKATKFVAKQTGINKTFPKATNLYRGMRDHLTMKDAKAANALKPDGLDKRREARFIRQADAWVRLPEALIVGQVGPRATDRIVDKRNNARRDASKTNKPLERRTTPRPASPRAPRPAPGVQAPQSAGRPTRAGHHSAQPGFDRERELVGAR